MQLACNTLWIGQNIVWDSQTKTKFVSKSWCSPKKIFTGNQCQISDF